MGKAKDAHFAVREGLVTILTNIGERMTSIFSKSQRLKLILQNATCRQLGFDFDYRYQ